MAWKCGYSPFGSMSGVSGEGRMGIFGVEAVRGRVYYGVERAG